MGEVWKPIPGTARLYEASSAGRVRSVDRYVVQGNRWGEKMRRFFPGRVLTPYVDRNGYRVYMHTGLPSQRAARLVALAFLPNPTDKPQVNHKNGNRADDRATNLEWMTNSENHLHAFRDLGRKPNRNGMKAVRVSWPNGAFKTFNSVRAAASYLKVVPTAVGNALRKGTVTGNGCRVVYE